MKRTVLAIALIVSLLISLVPVVNAPSSSSSMPSVPPTVEWEKTLGSGGIDRASQIIQTIDGGYAVLNSFSNYIRGTFYGRDTLVKMDSSGNVRWSQTYKVLSQDKLGNYWSNYTQEYPNAKEVDSSGTGDVPYIIGTDNTDYHPLVTPVSNAAASALAETLVTAHSPSPTPSSRGVLSQSTLVLFVSSAVVVIVIVLAAIAIFRRRKKQTLPPSST